MSPRQYRMTKRTASVAETRQRIVETTVALHGQKGIFGTSWQDIAREADVAIGTVYKHFPSLDELVPACGELLMQRIQPPSPDDADKIIGDAGETRERLYRIASELFAFYERGGIHLESDLRERQLPAVREWEDHLRGMVSHFVIRACDRHELGEGEVQAASVLLDFPTFRAMRLRGIGVEAAVVQAVDMIAAWLDERGTAEHAMEPGQTIAGGRHENDPSR